MNNSNELAAELAALRRIDFDHVVVSAAIDDSGKVDPVEGMKCKLDAVGAAARSARPVCAIGVAKGQEKQGGEVIGFEWILGDNLAELAEALAYASDAERRFGPRVDIPAVFQAIGHYGPLSGRQWLREDIDRFIAAHDRGLYVFVADPGFGKTAFCLDLAKRSLDSRLATPLAGWAFARQSSFELSGHAPKVLAQFEREVRYRCNLPRRKGGQEVAVPDVMAEPEEEMRALLSDLGSIARPDRKIVLLIDGVDEAFHETYRLERILPGEWPPHVYLVLAGRSPGLATSALYPTDARPLRRLACRVNGAPASTQENLWRTGNAKDLRDYVTERADEIRKSYGPGALPEVLEGAIIDAAEGCFFVASGLLRERDDLLPELAAWAQDSQRIPRGVEGYIRDLIRQVVQRTLAALSRDAGPTVHALLGLVALTQGSLRWPSDLTRLLAAAADPHRSSAALPEYTRLNAPDWIGGFAVSELDAATVKAVIEQAARLDLFGSHGGGSFPLVYWHTRMREVAARVASEHLGHPTDEHIRSGVTRDLHRVLAAGCARWRDFEGNLRDYALRFGTLHAANGGARNAAAEWLMDFGPRQDGYLDVLWKEYPRVAWNHTARVVAAAFQCDPDGDLLTKEHGNQLRALKRALVADQPYIVERKLPLIQTLYNRLAGRWDEHTRLGMRLREAARSYSGAWIEKLNLDPADAAGPLMRHLPAPVSDVASTDDGCYIAAGLQNGEVWVWTREELLDGLPGRLAIRHDGWVEGINIVSMHQTSDHFLLVSTGSGPSLGLTTGNMAFAGDVVRAKAIDGFRSHVPHVKVLAIPGTSNEFVLTAAGRYAAKIATGVASSLDSIAHCFADPGFEIESNGDVAIVAAPNVKGGFAIAISSGRTVRVMTGATALAGRWEDLPPGIESSHFGPGIALASAPDVPGGFVLVVQDGQMVLVMDGEAALRSDATAALTAIAHDGDVTAIAVVSTSGVPGGFLLVSGSADGTVRLTTAQSALAGTIDAARIVGKHEAAVERLAVLAPPCAGTHVLASWSLDGVLRISTVYVTPNGEIMVQSSHEEGQRDLLKPKFALHSNDPQNGDVFLTKWSGWTLTMSVVRGAESENGGKQRTAIEHKGSVHAAALLAVPEVPGGFVLASGGSDGTVRIMDGESARRGMIGAAHIAIKHDDSVWDVALVRVPTVPGGFVVASGSSDHTVRVADGQSALDGRTQMQIAVTHQDGVRKIALLDVASVPGGFVVSSLGNDWTLRVTSGEAALLGDEQTVRLVTDFCNPDSNITMRSVPSMPGGFLIACDHYGHVQLATGQAAMAGNAKAAKVVKGLDAIRSTVVPVTNAPSDFALVSTCRGETILATSGSDALAAGAHLSARPRGAPADPLSRVITEFDEGMWLLLGTGGAGGCTLASARAGCIRLVGQDAVQRALSGDGVIVADVVLQLSEHAVSVGSQRRDSGGWHLLAASGRELAVLPMDGTSPDGLPLMYQPASGAIREFLAEVPGYPHEVVLALTEDSAVRVEHLALRNMAD